ncbi:hypothetical protein [Streptomyces roseoviridis]|uniref:Uncharacterized protein n=1 Tax=Streptomyces roseoviridis TaxID=67361 RepID=A0ABV5QJE6_9ACTN
MSDDIKTVIQDIADLKRALFEINTDQEKHKVTYPGNHEAADKNDRKDRPFETYLTDLKRALIAVEPKIVTDDLLPYDFAGRFASMYEELQKEPMTEYLEGMGLGGLAAAWEKFSESRTDDKIEWQNWLYAAIGGMVLALILPAIGVYLAGRLNNISRNIREWASRDGTFRAMDENGDLTRQTREQIERRERRVANGGSSVADLDPNTNFDALRGQLQSLNPHLEKFNEHAGPFTRAFARLPKTAAITKAAEAIEKVNKAASEADVEELKKTAGAIKRLVNATQNFNPRKIPKANSLSSAATAAQRLADNTNEAGRAFDYLKERAQLAAQSI